jgi:hypothetical protein
MTDKEQLEQFKQAVDEKNEAAQEKAEQGPQNPRASDIQGDEPDLIDAGTPQDTTDVRKKSSGKGHVTADKWNQ